MTIADKIRDEKLLYDMDKEVLYNTYILYYAIWY